MTETVATDPGFHSERKQTYVPDKPKKTSFSFALRSACTIFATIEKN
jgi:hypothetical protein